MNKKVYIKDWLLFKPYESQTISDSYYLKLSNTVKQAIVANKHSSELQKVIKKEDFNLLACFLTSYFEDLISETNIWNSFISVNKRLYKKQLPFYKLDHYYEEETNIQDVCFLIWYFFNTIQNEKFVAPFNMFIVEIAENVLAIFDKAWEDAPENNRLKSFYQIDDNEDDFYIARNLIGNVLFKTYLFTTDTLFDLKEKDLETIKEKKNDENLAVFLNDNREFGFYGSHTRLLSLTGKEWVSEILGDKHPLSNDFLNISNRINGYFLYKGQDEKDIFLEHIASSKKFNLTKKSFENPDDLKEIDTILFISIVRWKDEWWFSGAYYKIPFNSDMVLEEKTSIKSKINVNSLDHDKQEVVQILKKQLKAFKVFNNGLQIAFVSSNKVEEFYKAYIEFFNKSQDLSAEKVKNLKKESFKEDFLGVKEKQINYSEVSETALVFFNPKSGIEIGFAVNSAFPMPNNPYFDEEYSEDHIMTLLMDESLSTELAMYCIDNFKNKLSFFSKGIGKIYLKDIDFLLRFWKKDNYHTKPALIFIEQEEK